MHRRFDELSEDLSGDERDSSAAPLTPASRRLAPLADALRQTQCADDGHYGLDELIELAAQCRRAGSEWSLPEHLSACPICLDVFEAALQPDAHVPGQARQRYLDLFDADGEAGGRKSRSHGYVCGG